MIELTNSCLKIYDTLKNLKIKYKMGNAYTHTAKIIKDSPIIKRNKITRIARVALQFISIKIRKLLWTFEMGDTNWDYINQLIEKTKNSNDKLVTF